MAKATVYVVVYEVDRAFGGREEGGWWYDTGHLVHSVPIRGRKGQVMAKAAKVLKRTRREWPENGSSSSVLGGHEDYRCWIETSEPAEYFPTERPYYE